MFFEIGSKKKKNWIIFYRVKRKKALIFKFSKEGLLSELRRLFL